MTDTDLKTLVIIPAYNEESRIHRVVNGAAAEGFDVLVVNDGSEDGTEVAAKDGGAEVISLEQNQGKGTALKKGFEYAIQKGYSTVAIMDGDGQHKASELADLVAALDREKCDIVVGNRMNNASNMPFIRRMTNKTTSRIISWLARTRISDSQSGFRAVRTDVLKNITLTTSRYDTESEMLILAGRKKYIIREIPVSTIYGTGEKSSIRPFIDAARFIKLVIRCLFSR